MKIDRYIMVYISPAGLVKVRHSLDRFDVDRLKWTLSHTRGELVAVWKQHRDHIDFAEFTRLRSMAQTWVENHNLI